MPKIAHPIGAGVGFFETKPDASTHCFHLHLITVSQDKGLWFGYDFNRGNTGSVPELTKNSGV